MATPKFTNKYSTAGLNVKGIKTLVTEIDTKIGNVLKAMESNATEFKNIETTIKKYWVGVDADNFVKSLWVKKV